MSKVLSLLSFAFLFVAIKCSAFDPCISPTLIGDNEYRGTQCFGKSSFICDRGMFSSGWYYSKSSGEYQSMPETCPAPATCGTMSPIWLKGKHPSQSEGIVNRMTCVRGLLDDDCCRENITIQLKNCGNFYVYNLPETQACDVAYCFGNDTCPVPSSTMTASQGLASSDPCNSAESLPKSNIRGRNCQSQELDRRVCDRQLQEQWYKVDIFGILLNMPQTCVPVGSCGTQSPIWMNGTTPVFSEGVVTRKACVRGSLDNQCCKKTIDIKVRNCITHNVYYLSPVSACDESYCFGLHPCVQEKMVLTEAPKKSRENTNVFLYVIIGTLMFLLTVASVMICFIRYKQKNTRGRSKVDVKYSPAIIFDFTDPKNMSTQPTLPAPPPYTERI